MGEGANIGAVGTEAAAEPTIIVIIVKTKTKTNKIKTKINKNQEKDQDIHQTHHIPVVIYILPKETQLGTVKNHSLALGKTKLLSSHRTVASSLKINT